ncbi:MAG: hypothetical protein IJF49_01760 [Clostridia bacterium]|nr:hypothetical protein [Clostridia bacterium]
MGSEAAHAQAIMYGAGYHLRIYLPVLLSLGLSPLLHCCPPWQMAFSQGCRGRRKPCSSPTNLAQEMMAWN